MFRQIQKIKNLGVFKDYVRPNPMCDFGIKNVMYGWNYSGKTTISRLFGLLESKKSSDFKDLKFTITDDTGVITEQNYQANTKTIRVFNSDFIANNLNFSGSTFSPILLLGEESKEAEDKIECLEKKLTRCDTDIEKIGKTISVISSFLSTAKSQESASIKKNIRLIPAFGATQLAGYITTVNLGENYLLSDDALTNDLAIAHSAEADKPPSVSKIAYSLRLIKLHKEATDILLKKPEFSNTLQYLVDHHDIANWVESGLPLHDGKGKCEFCGNDLKTDRLAALHAHFSKDLIDHKRSLTALVTQVEDAALPEILKQESQFNSQFRKRLSEVNRNLGPAISTYNGELKKLLTALHDKLKTPFDTHQIQPLESHCQTAVQEPIVGLNSLIDENNTISNNFASEKNKAIERLKLHFTQEFVERTQLGGREARIATLERRQNELKKLKPLIETAINEQKAIISLAQKGRMEINTRIENLLGSDHIQIMVVKVDGTERFQLIRGGEVARHLSEGEKTAIAFAFFLTKLGEIKSLCEAIIYIDDPISSLDSNHIFQVAAIIKSTFFYQEVPGKSEWLTRCKQLFLSTHNFEFFSLLRELPIGEKKSGFYMVKRLTPTTSTFINLPKSIWKYSSEYHYLFSVLHEFNSDPDKTNLEVLLSIPNAIRRFVELYTYARCPDYTDVSVDRRADLIWGEESSKRILKVLHMFSHSNNIERIATNTDSISDIENAVSELMTLLQKDEMHYSALNASVS